VRTTHLTTVQDPGPWHVEDASTGGLFNFLQGPSRHSERCLWRDAHCKDRNSLLANNPYSIVNGKTDREYGSAIEMLGGRDGISCNLHGFLACW